MRPWMLGLGISIAFIACGGSQVTAPAPLPSDDSVEGPSPDNDALDAWITLQTAKSEDPAVLVTTARGPVEQDARELAIKQLEQTFWATSVWPTLPETIDARGFPQPELFQESKVEHHHAAGEHAVVASMEVATLVELIARWMEETQERLPPPAETTASFGNRLGPLVQAVWFEAASTLLCDRIHSVGPDATEKLSCPDPNQTGPDSELQRLTDGIVFESRFHDGVPLDLAGKPTRPLEVLISWSNGEADPIPAGGLPIQVTDGGALMHDLRAVSNPRGVASLAFADQAPPSDARIGIELNREALVGPMLADRLPEFALSIPFRRIAPGTARVGIWIHETLGDSETSYLATSLQDALRELRSAPVILLNRDLAEKLNRLDPASLGALADLARGKIDVLVTGEATSQLTSRMGSRSVYHEATADLRVYDLWSGSQLTSLKNSAQSLGLGETRAAKNALQKLGEQLAASLHGALQRPVATVLDRP